MEGVGAAAVESLASTEFSVEYALEIENLSDEFLDIHECYIESGHVINPPTSLHPGKADIMSGMV